MPLSDISGVTRSLINLLERAFVASPEWASTSAPNVSPEPPSRMRDDGLGLYLFHVQESPHHLNFPPRGQDFPPVQHSPMGLILYYQLSVNSTQNTENSAFFEQRLMSIALKAFHDYPIINDATQIAGQNILVPSIAGRQNQLKTKLLNLPQEQAIQFWTAGSSPVKLSAYYQVEVVFLEPEELRVLPGRVLQTGIHVYPLGAPQVVGTQSMVRFVNPIDGLVNEVKAQPAQVAAGNDFVMLGSGFTDDEVELWLFNSRWKGPARADANWNLRLVGANQLMATVQPAAVLVADGSSLEILPGIYTAQLRVTRTATPSALSTSTISTLSNQFPFIISPRIDRITEEGDLLRIQGAGFQPDDALNPDRLMLFLGTNRLTMTNENPPTAGTFRLLSRTEILFNRSGSPPGQQRPLRLLVNGADSAPNWEPKPDA